jgi:hypothetical protein
MNVGELIQRLQTFDSALNVVMPGAVDPDFTEVHSAFVDTVHFDAHDKVQLSDERDTGWVEVVRLFGADEDG